MAHPAQQQFFAEITKRFEDICHAPIKVLEVGSQNINGTVRGHFPSATEYLGVDIGRGQDVDWVVPGELLQLPDAWADIVVTTECLEHCEMWEQVFLNMIRMLRPAGLFIMTCASTGRATHGTLDSEEYSSPFTTSYYRNLGADDIAEKIILGEFFDKHSFEAETMSGDLYFWGIRGNAVFNESANDWIRPLDRLARAQGQLAQAVSLHADMSKTRDELAGRVTTLEAELAEAKNSLEESRNQLVAQIDATHQIQLARDEEYARAASLEVEFSVLKHDYDELALQLIVMEQALHESQMLAATVEQLKSKLANQAESQLAKNEVLCRIRELRKA